jgi:hypothetical protein
MTKQEQAPEHWAEKTLFGRGWTKRRRVRPLADLTCALPERNKPDEKAIRQTLSKM